MRLLLLIVTVFSTQALFAQEQTHYFAPIARDGQRLLGLAAAEEGAVGFAAQKASEGFRVAIVASGSPAEKSGIKIDDLITAIDDNSVDTDGQADFMRRLNKKPGDNIRISYVRNGRHVTTALLVDSRANVFPAEARMPPSVSQVLFGGHADVIATVSQIPSEPQAVQVSLVISNINAQPISADDSKFFMLNGQNQQMRHMSLDEVKYSIQNWLAVNWKDGNYPSPNPPPPQHSYVITGNETGNYTFTDAANFGTLSGTSSSSYAVEEQPDYNQAGYMLGYSLGIAIRQRADRKHDDEIMRQAQQTLANWDATYFRSQSPVIPGENRAGAILYWSGSARQETGPFKVVLFLTDPSTEKQEMVQFEFH